MFTARGIAIAAVSYDSVAILADFAKRRNIGFPLLSDAGSRIVRSLGLLSPDYPENDRFYGVPHPTTFLLDARGVVVEKHSEEGYRPRRSAASLNVLAGGDAMAAVEQRVTSLFPFRTAASNASLYPGQKVSLVVDIDLPPGHHAYAVGDHRYRGLAVELIPDPVLEYGPPQLPDPILFYFEPLDETVPVFEGRVRFTRDVMLIPGDAAWERIDAGEPLTVYGRLLYQICTDTVCHPPAEVDVSWTFELEARIRERAPEELREHLR